MRTHSFINEQGIEVLAGDGHNALACFLEKQKYWLEQGSMWVDKPKRYIEHYLLPIRGKGLWCWPNAGTACERYYKEALNYWRKGNLPMSMFYLGAAVHLVQDLCVPYHAHGLVFSGHRRFEYWSKKNKELFGIFKGGLYEEDYTPFQWVYHNACEAHPVYWCLKENFLECYPFTAQKMLYLAQQTSAGFFYSFFHKVM